MHSNTVLKHEIPTVNWAGKYDTSHSDPTEDYMNIKHTNCVPGFEIFLDCTGYDYPYVDINHQMKMDAYSCIRNENIFPRKCILQ